MSRNNNNKTTAATTNTNKMPEVLPTLVPLVLLCVSGNHGFKTGAPASRCGNMEPQHYGANIYNASGTEPFYITTSKPTYSPGEELEVELKSQGDQPFKGFMLQARVTASTQFPSGQFSLLSGQHVQLLACNGHTATGVTHTANLSSTTGIKVTWRAPGHDQGTVTFVATVVQEFLTIYKWVKSQPLAFLHHPTSDGQGRYSVTITSSTSIADNDINDTVTNNDGYICNGTVCSLENNTTIAKTNDSCNGATCHYNDNTNTTVDGTVDGDEGDGVQVLHFSLSCFLLCLLNAICLV